MMEQSYKVQSSMKQYSCSVYAPSLFSVNADFLLKVQVIDLIDHISLKYLWHKKMISQSVLFNTYCNIHLLKLLPL